MLLSGALALTLLGACTDPKPEPEAKARPPKRQRAKPVDPAPPEPQTEPRDEPTPPPVVDTRPMSEWWCLCYQREGASGPEAMTACRETKDQCNKLESRVAKGSAEIIAGSLTNGCRSISGRHPSDSFGTPEQWQPSALAGSWVSEGVCQLQGAAVVQDPDQEEPVDEEPDFSVSQNELIGELALGQDTAKVRHSFGEPPQKTTIEEEGATGDWIQTWRYPDGLSLDMRSDTRGGPQSIRGITITAPSTLKTRRGMTIGSSAEAVKRAYGDVEAKDTEPSDDGFVAGSIYGGLFFTFSDGKVSEIYLGPGAE